MKLRSLSLSNVRKFAGQTAKISGIGDGVTVVSEANEFGKSTFFDALHALFFLKYGAATRDVKSLQPRSGGPVRIRAEIELPTGRFTLEKSFLAQKRASVYDSTGQLIALDDEAEAWIAGLLGSGLEGPAGLLWVRQGITALEPSGNVGADKTEKARLLEARRDLLSSVAGEIDMVTGGRRMDRVIEAATQALGRLATATGQPKANGPWKEAEVEASTYVARHAELDARCRELSQALSARRNVTARLKAMEAPGVQEALSRAFENAQNTYNAATVHADRVAQAQAQADLKKLELEGAQSKLDQLIASEAEYKETRQQFEQATDVYSKAAAALETEEVSTQVAHEALMKASAQVADATHAKDVAQQEVLCKIATEKLERQTVLLDQIMQKRGALEELTAAVAALPVTAQALAEIEGAQANLARAQSEAVAGGVQMHLTYDGLNKALVDGQPIESGFHHIAERQVIMLPGIGEMVLDPGSAASDMEATSLAQAQLDAALSEVGMASADAARKSAAQRQEKHDEAALLKSVLETLAPEGIERVQAGAAQAKADLEALSLIVDQVAVPADPAEIATRIEEALRAEHTARIAYETCRDKRDTERTNVTRAQMTRDGAKVAFEMASALFSDPDTFAERKAEAARNHLNAQITAKDAEEAAKKLRADAPDLEMAKADLNRAKSAAENAREERAQLQTRSADLSATIRARAEDGVEEKRDEAEGLMIGAQERAARFAHEAAGLTLLVEALRAKRGAAQEAYFGPVQQELAPLLNLLHADAALSFDPGSLLPQGMARGGTDETMDVLSGGTQEQIAILTRLAFARLFARQGKPMPVILDDALVYSDDSRISAMFTALHRVATDQQVIVFSCRQMAFAGLGGTRPMVEITQDQ